MKQCYSTGFTSQSRIYIGYQVMTQCNTKIYHQSNKNLLMTCINITMDCIDPTIYNIKEIVHSKHKICIKKPIFVHTMRFNGVQNKAVTVSDFNLKVVIAKITSQ